MNLTKPQLIVIVTVIVIVLVFVLIFLGIVPGLKTGKDDITRIQATLNFWAIGQDKEAYDGAIAGFNKIYPNVTINIRAFASASELEYERTVLNALAAGTGPDIFMIQNGALLKELGKITPALEDRYSLLSLRRQFPQVVEEDFVYQGQIYALPLSIDTLVLIYNRSIFNQAGVVLPPSTWEDFDALVPRLVKEGEGRRIVLAAAAIGGSQKSIDRASDILGLLMLQKGSAVTKADRAGIDALSFYTKFANAASQSYTWNDTMPKALAAFSQEKTAMIFEYAAAIPTLKSRNPFFNFVVAPAPQFAQAQKAVAYPRYFGYVVAKQSRYSWLAWDFVINLTTNLESAKAYMEQTGLPPALNTLINQKVNDPEMSVFARQSLLAKTWAKTDSTAANTILSEVIEFVISGRGSPESALKRAQEQFEQL
jgi:ABC-type glycerol-3-phosphate transport system substrate-binding protein